MIDPIKLSNFPKTMKFMAFFGTIVLGSVICNVYKLVPIRQLADFSDIFPYLAMVMVLTWGYEGHKILKEMEASLEKSEKDNA